MCSFAGNKMLRMNCIGLQSKTLSKIKLSIGCLKQHQTHSDSGLDDRQHRIMSRGLPKKKLIPGVKHIVLIASGKGGVGKSTTAVNLATALAEIKPSLQVGLLDADIFGPSIPLMMNLSGEPLLTSENLMIPLVNYGVKSMSMGYLVAQEAAVMWRGLMVMQALNRLMFEVDWGPTDVLVVDTPPGTGDTHLSLLQNLVVSGVLVVTTPQQMALQVTRRGVTMFRKLQVPLIGLVQNMGSVVCSNCCHRNELFGPAIKKFSEELDIEVVQDIPLHSDISACGDEGKPVLISHPSSPIASSYRDLARRVYNFLKL